MFIHGRMPRCRNIEERTETDSRSSHVPLMLLCCRRARISYGVLTGRNIECACNKMEGVGERELRILGVGVTDQWSCCNQVCMWQAKVVEERGYILRRMFS